MNQRVHLWYENMELDVGYRAYCGRVVDRFAFEPKDRPDLICKTCAQQYDRRLKHLKIIKAEAASRFDRVDRERYFAVVGYDMSLACYPDGTFRLEADQMSELVEEELVAFFALAGYRLERIEDARRIE